MGVTSICNPIYKLPRARAWLIIRGHDNCGFTFTFPFLPPCMLGAPKTTHSGLGNFFFLQRWNVDTILIASL